jgi:hypothetical protein
MVAAAGLYEGGHGQVGWAVVGMVALGLAFFSGSIAAYQWGVADSSYSLATDMERTRLMEALTYFLPKSVQYREAATLYGGITGVLALIAVGAFVRATR